MPQPKSIRSKEMLGDLCKEKNGTSCKPGEQELQELRHKLDCLAQANPLAIIEWNQAFEITEWNSSAEEIFGYRIREAIARRGLELIFPVSSWAKAKNLFGALLQQASSFHGMYENCTKDGKSLICEWHNTTLTDTKGQVIGAVSIVQNVTERLHLEADHKQAKAELQALQQVCDRQQMPASLQEAKQHQSEARLQALIKAIPDLMLWIARDGTYLDFILPRDFKTVVGGIHWKGKSIFEMMPLEHAQERMAYVEKALQTGETQIYEYQITVNGETRIEEARISVVNPNEVLTIVRDISERKRAEIERQRIEAERKRAEQYRHIRYVVTNVLAEASTLNDHIPKLLQAICKNLDWHLGEFWMVDQQAQILQCKASWQGRSPKIIEFSRATQHCDFALGRGLPGNVWASGQPIWITNLLKDTQFLRATPARKAGLKSGFGFPVTSGGKVLGVMTFFSSKVKSLDHELLTILESIGGQIGQLIERRQAEEALRQSEQQLKQKAQDLEQTLKELQRTQAQLIQSEKMSSLGQLVAGMAHELNNPVSFISGNLTYANNYTQNLLNLLNLYRSAYPEPVPAIQEQAEAIDLDFITADLTKLLFSMKVGADRIRQIVASLRTFSRLDEAEFKAVDIHEGIDSTLMILQNRFRAKSIYLEGQKYQCPEIQVIKDYANLPLIPCYAGQLNQAFINILSNALDALEEATKHGKWGEPEGEESTLAPCIRIQTEALDNNVIIRITDNGSGIAEEVRKQLFDPFFTTKSVGKGTGMGLSISYQIVAEKHNGSLQCFSVLGEGAEFVIKIPMQQEGSSAH